MAKLINGQITSIDEGIVGDIEALIYYVRYISEDKKMHDAAERVHNYIATYKLDETEHD